MSNFFTLVQVVRFLAPIVALFHIFFYFDDQIDADVIYWTTIFGRIFDVILWLNIGLKFFTAVEVAERQTYCKDLKKIITQYEILYTPISHWVGFIKYFASCSYLFRPNGFFYDVAVAFPYDIVTGYKATRWMFSRCLLSVRGFNTNSESFKLYEQVL